MARLYSAIQGSIQTKKLADFILLNKNPLEVIPDELESITTDAVFIDGKEIISED